MLENVVAAFTVTAGLLIAPPDDGQDPHAQSTEGMPTSQAPDVAYTLRVDSTDLSGFDVAIRIRNISDTFRLAMAVHPEYNDRFYRYVENLAVSGAGEQPATIVREDSTLWKVTTTGGECLVRYRVHLPPGPYVRSGWVPFLSPTGGLIGGLHSFMYVVGATHDSARVTLVLPPGWAITTGLEPTSDPHSFVASNAYVLADSPILVGRLRSWEFSVQDVPHQVVYWPLPEATPFDTTALVDGIRQIVEQAVALFGSVPYSEYAFLLQDGAAGSLEHLNSVTIGAQSRSLSEDLRPALAEIAHEFFHTWNLVRIRPIEYGDLDFRPPPGSRGLWWSEGVTMYYADVLLRRAALPGFEPTRLAHFEQIISHYYENPGQSRFSPESVSVVANGRGPGSLGDYAASPHLQGEMLGTLLDFIVRDATGGRRSMDDVLRLMYARYAGRSGFDRSGVERAVHDVCGCRVHQFFERYVRTAHPMDFDRYLRLAGLKLHLTWSPAADDSGRTVPDLRIFPYQAAGQPGVRLIITTPDGLWGRAGIHTNDQVLALNGTPVESAVAFRDLRNRLRIGDTARVEIARATGPTILTVLVRGYDRPVAKVEELPDASEKARRIRAVWEAGR